MSDLRCDEVVELVTDFLDHVLDADAEQRVLEHLTICDGCQTYVAQFRQTVDELRRLPAEQRAALPEPTRARLLAQFRRATS
jgi:anti-sigma factor RsiW